MGYNEPQLKTGPSGAGNAISTPDRHLGLSKERLMPQCNRIPFVFVPLTKNHVAIVDAEDAERVLMYRWSVFTPTKSGIYAQGRVSFGDGPKVSISLHRYIMRPPKGLQVDHINGNGLDCRKSNMRVATRSQNCSNRGKHSGGQTSVYKGVRKVNRRWGAQIGKSGKHLHLGYFDTEIEAALAYDRAAVDLHGDFASLNFPEVK